VPLRVPALHERREDIPLLVEHFLAGEPDAPAVPQAVMDKLVARPWLGNVRELKNLVERATLLGWDDVAAAAETAGVSESYLRRIYKKTGVGGGG